MSSKHKDLDKNKSMETLKRILDYIGQYRRGVIMSLYLQAGQWTALWDREMWISPV